MDQPFTPFSVHYTSNDCCGILAGTVSGHSSVPDDPLGIADMGQGLLKLSLLTPPPPSCIHRLMKAADAHERVNKERGGGVFGTTWLLYPKKT